MHLAPFVEEALYSGCALAFLALIELMVLQGPTSKAGAAILGCCIASLIWASASAAKPRSPQLCPWQHQAFRLAVVRRSTRHRASERHRSGAFLPLGAVGFCLAAIFNDGWTLFVSPDGAALDTSQFLIRIGFGVAELLTNEI